MLNGISPSLLPIGNPAQKRLGQWFQFWIPTGTPGMMPQLSGTHTDRRTDGFPPMGGCTLTSTGGSQPVGNPGCSDGISIADCQLESAAFNFVRLASDASKRNREQRCTSKVPNHECRLKSLLKRRFTPAMRCSRKIESRCNCQREANQRRNTTDDSRVESQQLTSCFIGFESDMASPEMQRENTRPQARHFQQQSGSTLRVDEE